MSSTTPDGSAITFLSFYRFALGTVRALEFVSDWEGKRHAECGKRSRRTRCPAIPVGVLDGITLPRPLSMS